MGSPITFSGFNSIDWNQVLEAVMAQERQPVTTLQTQKSTLETQKTAFGTFLSKLSTLESAIDKLSTTTSINPTKAVSSSANVEVSASSTATAGTYNVVVSTLARAHVLATSGLSPYASADTVVATSGTLTITPATGDPVDIAVTDSTTITELAAAINAESDSPVTAAVVQTAPGQYQLVLTSKNTGAANTFTISSSLAGGTGLPATDIVQSGLNASFTVNGLAVQSASNIATEVVPGATLTLKKQDAGETVSITVSRDADAAVGLVNSFMNAYNDIVQFMKDQDTAALAGKASLARNPLLRGFRNMFRDALYDEYGTGTFTQLAQVGIGFDRNGKLTLDKTVLNASVASSATDVQTLISGADGTGGVFGALAATVEEYTKAGGLVGLARERLTTQVRGIDTRLDALEARLSVRRLALQKEYLEADRLMSQLQSQGNSLQQLGFEFKSLAQ